jgi:hypothetical protein
MVSSKNIILLSLLVTFLGTHLQAMHTEDSEQGGGGAGASSLSLQAKTGEENFKEERAKKLARIRNLQYKLADARDKSLQKFSTAMDNETLIRNNSLRKGLGDLMMDTMKDIIKSAALLELWKEANQGDPLDKDAALANYKKSCEAEEEARQKLKQQKDRFREMHTKTLQKLSEESASAYVASQMKQDPTPHRERVSNLTKVDDGIRKVTKPFRKAKNKATRERRLAQFMLPEDHPEFQKILAAIMKPLRILEETAHESKAESKGDSKTNTTSIGTGTGGSSGESAGSGENGSSGSTEPKAEKPVGAGAGAGASKA